MLHVLESQLAQCSGSAALSRAVSNPSAKADTAGASMSCKNELRAVSRQCPGQAATSRSRRLSVGSLVMCMGPHCLGPRSALARKNEAHVPKFLPPFLRPRVFPELRTLGWQQRGWRPAQETPAGKRSRRNATLFDGKHLATVCRINALWCLPCCALPVCGFGEGERSEIRSCHV